ncbi:MAG: NifB/NifX family molybdenum-iron cluster-binding protein [bacterium]|nr:NifB/NifX family molybdenum-iron cluster-binding protein [bacterium]
MKVAVSTEGTQVAPHFGRCPEYTIVEIEEGKVVKKETIQNPAHQPGFLPGYLASMGVNCIITGGMGHRAQGLFAQYNIETIIGVTGSIDQVIDNYLKGGLVGGKSLCDRGQPGHKECKH